MDELRPLVRLADALRPWLGQLVFVGGWAHRLYRLRPEAGHPAYLALRTRDADIAFSAGAALKGDIGAALRAAGFEEELVGEHVPPVSAFRLRGDEQGFYAEFLAPLAGSGLRRSGAADATLARAGVTAQKLRHLDILLRHPWSVRLDRREDPTLPPIELQVANPVAFIVQKLLIRESRPPDKQAQDTLYIHDTLDLLGGALASLRVTWQEQVRPGLSRPIAAAVAKAAAARYARVTDEVRVAARIPQDRRLEPTDLAAACRYGLGQVLG